MVLLPSLSFSDSSPGAVSKSHLALCHFLLTMLAIDLVVSLLPPTMALLADSPEEIGCVIV